MKTAVTSSAIAPVIIAGANTLDAEWRVANTTGATSLLVARAAPGADIATEIQRVAPNVEWAVAADAEYAAASVSASVVPGILERAKVIAGERLSIQQADALSHASRHMLAHARAGSAVSGSGILRLPPGTWHVEASDDGKRVVLTRA